MHSDTPTATFVDLDLFLRIAGRAAGRVLRSPVLIDEAAERAVHRLTLATLAGRPPQRPEAWVRVVARRAACALLRNGWACTQNIDEHQVPESPRTMPEGLERLRDQLAGQLSPRQNDALTAAMSCNTTKAAARSCGMKPRDFRRSLEAISRKARRSIFAESWIGAGFAARPTWSMPA